MLYTLITLSSLIFSNLAANCCIDATDAGTCGDVATSTCMWIEGDAAGLAASQGIPCVTDSWYACEVNGVCPPPPPVPPVPKACVFDACANNNEGYNIAFLIDESGSVGRTNYLISLDFIEAMVTTAINDVSPISMLAFASGLDRVYRFSDAQNDQKAGALAALAAERANYNSGGTCTATALREAANEFNTGLDPAQQNNDNILILMTDGYPNCGGNVCDEKAALDAANIKVKIVGVSGGFNANAVRCLVDSDDDIISIPKFDQKLFYHIEAQLRRVVCPADVFKGNFFNNLFVSDSTFINGVENMNNIVYIIGLLLLICGGFVYYFRQKICKKNDKYISLNDDKQSQYQSV